MRKRKKLILLGGHVPAASPMDPPMNTSPTDTSLLGSTLTYLTVADPGFPIGGGGQPFGGCRPLTWVLFGKNVCENERIGSRLGWAYADGTPPPTGSANA